MGYFFSRILTISDFPFIWNVNQFCSDPFECFFGFDFVHFVAVFASVFSSACFSTLFSTLNLILLFTSVLLIPAGRCGLLEISCACRIKNEFNFNSHADEKRNHLILWRFRYVVDMKRAISGENENRNRLKTAKSTNCDHKNTGQRYCDSKILLSDEALAKNHKRPIDWIPRNFKTSISV